jgi:hypothetical protein
VKKKELVMLTLSDINTATNSRDGDIYSDLYKDVYGSRPRYAQFASTEEFDADFEALVNMLNRKDAEEAVRQSANLERFFDRVLETMELCNCDQVRAIEIIADAEGELDFFKHYGYERLEWVFDLRFGSIKEGLEGGTE